MGCLYFMQILWPPRRVAAAIAIGLIVVGFICLLIQAVSPPGTGTSDASVGTFMCWLWSLYYGFVWFYKHSRDRQAVAQVKAQAQQAPPPSVIQPPTQTSRSTGRMRVPPPLDQDRQ